MFVVLGSIVRLRQYGARRSLWLDEASITDNIINRDLSGLTRPLDHHQGAPLGWLISEKVGVHLLGANEYGLRLTSFVSGILTLFVVWWLAGRILSRWLVPVAVGAAAVSPQLIRYTSEVKQYGSDAFAVTLIVALAVTIAQRKPAALSWKWAAGWAAAGSFVVMFSHTGILATISCCAVLLTIMIRGHHKVAFQRLAIASAVIAVVLFINYELALKNLSKDGALKAYWHDGNPPKPLAVGSFLRWLGRAIVNYVHDPLHLGPTLLVGAFFVVGTLALARRDRAVCALLVGPLILQLLVSAAGIFPLSGRLVLGYVPLILCALASAPAVVTAPPFLPGWIAALVLVPLIPNVGNAASLAVHPLHFEELRPVMQAVARDYRPDQLVFVQYPAIAAFGVYQRLGVNLTSTGKMYIVHGATCQNNDLLRRLGALGKQVWFISSHQLGSNPYEGDEIRQDLTAEGTVLRDIREPGAEALLVQIPATYESLTPGAPGNCLQVIRTR